MKYFEENLSAKSFIRIHRSYIVNVEFIDEIQQYEKDSYIVILKNKTSLKVSKSGFKNLKETLNFWFSIIYIYLPRKFRTILLNTSGLLNERKWSAFGIMTILDFGMLEAINLVCASLIMSFSPATTKEGALIFCKADILMWGWNIIKDHIFFFIVHFWGLNNVLKNNNKYLYHK